MSYDLYFYKKKNQELTEQEVSDYLNENFPLNNSEHPKQWTYENQDTSVYFSIDWNEPNTEEEDWEFWDNFADFEYLNYNFTINFIRPNFFGYEVFPILEKILEDLNIYILNPQDEIDPDKPQKFEKGYFEKQWIQHNERVILQNFNEFNKDYYPKEKSDYLWDFQYNREDLQNSLTEDIFVAGYFLIKKKSDNKLYSFCVWPSHIPIIFPPVDFVIIQKEYKKLFKTVKESGIVSFENIEKEFGKYIEDVECEIKNLKVITPNNSEKIAKAFNSMKIEYEVSKFGDFVPLDSFVNVKP